MPKLATTLHPYYPDTWFSKEQAADLLKAYGFTPHLTVAWCKQNAVNVASTGHIGQVSLQHYIDRACWQAQQDAIDLGMPIAVIMEDEIIHTDETPFCDDMTCPCHQYGNGTVEEYLQKPVREGKMSVQAAMNLYRGKAINLVK